MSNEVKNCADDYIEKQLFSGIEWRIEQAGELRLEGRSGYANYACKTPIPDRAIYRIYSMTKPIIAALAVLLVQKRLMRLSDPIAKYDPQFSKMRVLTPNGSLEPACRLITLED
jgi:CubicO group peptidase (beta-lactamase class C family)